MIHSEYGSVYWFCPDCDAVLQKGFVKRLNKETAKAANDVKAKKSDLLEKLTAETEAIKTTLDRVAAHLDGSGHSFLSPKRKHVKFQWEDDDINPTRTTFPDGAESQLQQCAAPPASIKYSEMVKLNIKSTNNVLKNLHDNRHLVSGMSTRKKKSDGSIDVLFKSFNEAQNAKNILDKKLSDAVVSNPSLDGSKRFHLVGLTFEMSKSEVVQSIIDENHWLNLEKSSEDNIMIKDDPFSIITVQDVKKCRNNEIFRVTVTLSKQLIASLGNRKISVGFSKCKLYEIPNHRRCYHCQRPGHLAKDCKNDVACSRCSLNHKSNECSSTLLKCVNCTINGENNVNHASYSANCPYNAQS